MSDSFYSTHKSIPISDNLERQTTEDSTQEKHDTLIGFPSEEMPTGNLRKVDMSQNNGNETQIETVSVSSVSNANHTPKEKTEEIKLSNEQVLAHTAGMWKYRHLPTGEPDTYPEYIEQEIGDNPDWHLFGVRVRGKKHKQEGTNSDDWFTIKQVNGVSIIAVADGAGSKKLSRIGARTACSVITGYLTQKIEQIFTEHPDVQSNLTLSTDTEGFIVSAKALSECLQTAIQKARDAVEAAWLLRYTDSTYITYLKRMPVLTDFSCTVLAVIVVPLLNGESFVISCQIGDGLIALVNKELPYEKAVRLLSEADHGAYAGETDFLTSKEFTKFSSLQKRTKVCRTKFDKLFVMTDGVADDYYPEEKGMKLLYLDLLANGILQNSEIERTKVQFSFEDFVTAKKLPLVSYPWVNDKKINITMFDTSTILEKLNCSLEELWQKRGVFYLASMRQPLGEDKKALDRLRMWLDGYTKRGSFDDRTLVILERKRDVHGKNES